jgi:hypothetical protein
MKAHMLDPEGLEPVPLGYTLVDNEVLFLRQATSEQLLVRGARLCTWAEGFFRARGLAFHYVRPIIDELRGVCPELTEGQAREIVKQLGPGSVDKLPRPLTTSAVLQQLYPAPLWRIGPSLSHVAEWLTWLYQADPPDHLWPLLKHTGRQWQETCEQTEQEFYGAANKEQADRLLERWIGGDGVTTFQAEIPSDLADRVVSRWQARIIQSRGEHFSYLITQKIPALLKERAAAGAANYYHANPGNLTPAKLHELSGYLNNQDRHGLYRILPPAAPAPLPARPEEILDWFCQSYFPYRQWQHDHATGAELREPVLQSALQFACWYLDHYPDALVGGELQSWLSMKRMAELSQQKESVTLVIVLDGLHAGDAACLLRRIEVQVPRLTTTGNDLLFSAVPTVTEFCKPSLFAAVPPRLAGEVPVVGQVISDKQLPAGKLAEADTGELVLWRVEEPDKTYHWRNSSESLLREIEGKLDTVVRNLQTIVEQVPDRVLLQLVVTTDHGRLLARSQREVPVPAGMTSHGRAAWGACPLPFDENSYIIKDNVAYLESYSYGLNQDAAVVLDEAAYETNDQRGGSELYPHGGLFPEEVIVPWLTFVRDAKEPQLEISISGSGTARKEGTLDIHVVNSDNRLVRVQQVALQMAASSRTLEVDWMVLPQSEQHFIHKLDDWPSADDVAPATLKGNIKVSLNNQLHFYVPAKVELQSEDMYRRDNILEDLF